MRRLLGVIAGMMLVPSVGACASSLDEVARNYALVIGVDKASERADDEIPWLRFASADALAMKEQLERTGRYEVTLLINQDADRRGIIRSFDQIAREARPKDTFLLFFAGHGVKSPVVQRQTHWVTYGTTVRDLEVDGLRMTHVIDYVQGIPAGYKLVILDHCFSGDVSKSVPRLLAPAEAAAALSAPVPAAAVHFQARDLVPESDVPKALQFDVSDQDTGAAIYAAAWSRAFESPALKHGLFTSVVLEAFGTDKAVEPSKAGILDLDELNQFMQDWRDNSATGLPQKPYTWRGGERTNWTILDRTGTSRQIEANAERYKGHVDALFDQGWISLAAKRHCEDAINNWKTALLANQPPATLDLRIVGLLSRLSSVVRGNLPAEQRGQAVTELLTELKMPLS